MDQTRVIQLLPWRCVLEMGNAKIQSPAHRQFFKETKNKKRKRVSDSKETGSFLLMFGYLLVFLDVLNFWNPGRQGSGKVHPKMKKNAPCLQLHPSSRPYLSKNAFSQNISNSMVFSRRIKKHHVGKPSTKNPTQLRMDSKIRPAAPARPWQLFQRDTTLMATRNPASFPTWEV